MERIEAIRKLRMLVGRDIVPLASEYEVAIWRGEKKNKGWAGHVLERYLGLPINSAQSPNFGSWELKVIPLKKRADGTIAVKETMAITMIDAYNVRETPFEESHLLAKLRKLVVCARLFEGQDERHFVLMKVEPFDLEGFSLYEQVKADYNETRACIVEKDFSALTGKMGVLIQPRTKGAGHGSATRAFYARTHFVAKILKLS